MAKLTRKQIKELAKSIIASNPGGDSLQLSCRSDFAAEPETPENKIHGSVRDLKSNFRRKSESQAVGFIPLLEKKKMTQFPPEALSK